MQNVIKIFQELQATTKKTEKENIIKRNKDNQLLLECLKFLLDSNITTGISKKKLDKKLNLVKTVEQLTWIEVMDYLQKNNSGRDTDIFKMKYFLNTQPEEYREFYYGMITKSLRLGCDAKTVNKSVGYDLISCFDVMLAEKYWDNMDLVNGKEFIITQKLDGNRLVCLNTENGVEFYSRQGKEILGLDDIKREVETYLPKGKVYDGEIILRNDNNLPSDKLFNETMKVVRKDGIKKNLIFHVFDLIDAEAFDKGIDKTPCHKRKSNLHSVLHNDDISLQWIQEVEILYQGSDTDKIVELLDEQIALKHEGIMINLSDAPYECKRTKVILKVKRMQTADVKVISVYEGDNDNKGKLGGVVFEFTHKGNTYQCKCGSGFSKEKRIHYFNNPDEIIGMIIEIRYFEISTNQKDKNYSMRFPVFKIERPDKSEISMY